ncbi:hypothetical protein DSM112329_02732 [Paraconexibacter sp. AEG42_29]|uniref:Uncharacterized protein n=1 Tax=Paraconexibacter sp. AEG42_29 TaxID=2997339 RepID=A0AAU7AW83_9ACTN
MILAHVAGFPVEELGLLATLTTGAGSWALLRLHARAAAERMAQAAIGAPRRAAPGATPSVRLNARANAASDA